jgi:hypothetical protein
MLAVTVSVRGKVPTGRSGKMLTIGHYDIVAKYPYELKLAEVQDGAGFTVEFQPRDGTRYVVVFRKPCEAERKMFGCAPDAWMVSYERGPAQFKSALLSPRSHYTYIKEKMEVNTYTAKVLEKLLDFVFEGEDIGPFPMAAVQEGRV